MIPTTPSGLTATRRRRPRIPGLAAAFGVALAMSVPAQAQSFRTIDGSGNHGAGLGAAGESLMRLTNGYDDGIAVPRGGDPGRLPSPREISNAIAGQSGAVLNGIGASDWLWQWGQFLSHDTAITPAGATEPFDVTVPAGDGYFDDPMAPGTAVIGFDRSIFDPATGTGLPDPRRHPNEITSFIDASNVYGSDDARALALRSGVDGLLSTSAGGNGETLLMFNTPGLPNDMSPPDPAAFFLAGDVRANEQLGLIATHTLFVREHNRLAGEIKSRLDGGDPGLDAAFTASGSSKDEFIYQMARKAVGAQIQAITYQEWLPLILGPGALDPFTGYDATVDPSIANEFSTAAFRIGHTMLSPQLLRIDGAGVDQGAVALRDAFFNPALAVAGGIDSVLLGLASQVSQAVDPLVIDDVRNFLFGAPGMGGFDLASLNLQRGRDHGVGSLNEVRAALGLPAHGSFAQLTGGDADLEAAFASVYGSIDDVDLWIGGLAEMHVNGGVVGETFHEILADQFQRLRDGDAFFYLNQPELDALALVDPDLASVRLADVIRRNSSVARIQDAAFLVPASILSEPAGAPLAALSAVVLMLTGRLRSRCGGRGPAPA